MEQRRAVDCSSVSPLRLPQKFRRLRNVGRNAPCFDLSYGMFSFLHILRNECGQLFLGGAMCLGLVQGR
jgi:hypothetical protein